MNSREKVNRLARNVKNGWKGWSNEGIHKLDQANHSTKITDLGENKIRGEAKQETTEN